MPNKYVYNYSDIVHALQGAGLNAGDTAYFSTSLGMLGFAEGVSTADQLNTLFFDAICETLGGTGNLLVPAYSYTFGGSTVDAPKIFDPINTPAEIGPFPNHVLKQNDVLRSLDPMMSMVGKGPKIKSLFHNLPSTSYGADSVYARLIDRQAKCVCIGLGPNWTPFIHHADWLNQVPFRYDKLFYGGIKQANGDIQYQYWLYSVPARIEESFGDAHILGKLALDAGIWKYHPLGRAGVYVCDYNEYFDFSMSLMKTNKWLMAKGPECNVVARDQEKLSRELHTPPEKLTNESDIGLVIDHIKACTRKLVSPEITYCLEILQKHYPIKLRHTLSGKNVYDWIVPERIEELNGEQLSSMGYLSTASWQFGSSSKPMIVLCCYIDESQDLSGLALTLSLINKLQHVVTPYQFHCIIAAGTPGFACEMQFIDESLIEACLHIVDSQIQQTVIVADTRQKKHSLANKILDNNTDSIRQASKSDFQPLQAGHNPIAEHKLADLPFDNSVLLIPKNVSYNCENLVSALLDSFKQ